jgi:hypothetical protein
VTSTPTGKAATTAQAGSQSEGDSVPGPRMASASGDATEGMPTLSGLVHLVLGGDSCLPDRPCN